ncbi:MAG TPA: tyrosine--tRNA ligase [Polyangiaceae bacterium]|nr:tyrosine--tRNA ligase [Polyangiaceae bacterium]
MQLLEDLAFRNLIYQQTNRDGLLEHLATPRRVYCGFDPTAPSLTIGNLVPILLLARFQRAGHIPVVIMGGGTGLIGDPSGKSAERPMLSAEDVEHNVQNQRTIFERVLDFSGAHGARLLNNASWLGKIGYLEMLRDVGKYFSVNMMIQKDSVRERLENREQGISYTEFSYMLLQAYDFLHLHDTEGVTVQVAGSDQWGNVVAGVDLIRRVRRVEAFGQTAPLVTKSDGTKFGKSESGAIWLSANRTSPYEFYQFWLNTSDADVESYLKIFTFIEPARITELCEEHRANPGARAAQRALARHVTELLHGADALAQAEAASAALFSGNVTGLSRETLSELFKHAPRATVAKAGLEGQGILLVDLLIQTQVAKSKREAREFLDNKAIQLNGELANLDTRVTTNSLLYGESLLIRRGKKLWYVINVE